LLEEEKESDQDMGNLFRIFIEENDNWQMFEIKDEVHKKTVLDIGWAPMNGRKEHMIVTCSAEGAFIWFIQHDKLKKECEKDLIKEVIKLNIDPSILVMKVSWNLIATVLVTSTDDNKIKMWKRDYNNNWNCVNTIEEEEPAEENEEENPFRLQSYK